MTIAKLNDLRNLVLNTKDELERYAKLESVSNYKEFLEENIGELDKALSSTTLPEFYKVAVVGRFKVGKSSFVNAFTNSKIAGVSDKPETAAISVFRNADNVFAEVEMLDKKTWLELKDTENRRYFNFSNFNERNNKEDPFDLVALETEYIKEKSLRHRINLDESLPQKKAAIEFRKNLKKFTSSQSPLHYLVKQIVIYTPNSLLGTQVELIDTPGLDDTELFRSELTEETLKNVDAILFLTSSGDSYSQSDKEFLIKQLRTRQIKQLQIIVTKVDGTYANKIMQCNEEEEDIPTLEEFKKEEEMRIRREIRLTLHELLNGDTESESAHYYKKQLENIPIHLISTHDYSKGEIEQSGLPAVKQALNNALSNSARFSLITNILEGCLDRILNRTEAIFSDRLDAIDSDFDEVDVQKKLENIRECLLSELEKFRKKLALPLEEMQQALKGFDIAHKRAYLYGIDQDARRVIANCCREDVSKHWATRRAGNWGSNIYSYGNTIGKKVANKIFPQVEIMLEKYTGYINEYAEAVKLDLASLQLAIEIVEEKNALSGLKALTLQDCLSRLSFKSEATQFIESSKEIILQSLDSFSNEARIKLYVAQSEVGSISGKGTASKQNQAVYDYYSDIEEVLSDSLMLYLESELEKFSISLINLAESVKPKVERSLTSELDNKVSAISNSLLVMNEAKKEETINYLVEVIDWCERQRNSFQKINQEVI